MKKEKKTHIIIVGNEKGGTGKSTISMHIIVALLKKGLKVSSMDLDFRQSTLSRYIENRIKSSFVEIPMHKKIAPSENDSKEIAFKDDAALFVKTLDDFKDSDYIVIDTPGHDNNLSQIAHSHADTLVSPLNDSLIDLDVFIRLEKKQNDRIKPSVYAQMVWEQKKKKAMIGGQINWVVARNRINHIHSKNKQKIIHILSQLSKKLGFSLINGLSDRVIFKELFVDGGTLFDIDKMDKKITLSHITAKHELQSMITK